MSVTVLYGLRTGRRLSKAAVEDTMREVRGHLGFPKHAVGLWVASERVMAERNRELRGKRGATDVISVPVLEFEAPKQLKRGYAKMKDLGDVMLCLPYVVKQSAAEGRDVDDRLQELLVHSMLHLVGYVHEEDADWEAMQAEEDRIAALLGKRHYFLD